MDPFSLIASVWWLGLPVALIMGALLTVNPAAWPVLGAALGMSASGELGAPRGGLKLVSAFGAGLVVVYTSVGIFAGAIDAVTERFLRPYEGIGYLILGGALVGIAAFLLLRPASFCAACARSAPRSATVAGAFLAGLPAGFVNCPACAGDHPRSGGLRCRTRKRPLQHRRHGISGTRTCNSPRRSELFHH